MPARRARVTDPERRSDAGDASIQRKPATQAATASPEPHTAAQAGYVAQARRPFTRLINRMCPLLQQSARLNSNGGHARLITRPTQRTYPIYRPTSACDPPPRAATTSRSDQLRKLARNDSVSSAVTPACSAYAWIDPYPRLRSLRKTIIASRGAPIQCTGKCRGACEAAQASLIA